MAGNPFDWVTLTCNENETDLQLSFLIAIDDVLGSRGSRERKINPFLIFPNTFHPLGLCYIEIQSLITYKGSQNMKPWIKVLFGRLN